MRYIGFFLVGFFLGNFFIGCSINVSKNVDVTETKVPDTKKLPKEVQEQFDAYLMTSPIAEKVIITIVKKVVQGIFVATVVSLVYDYPIQALILYLLCVPVVSYFLTKYLFARLGLEVHPRYK
jgi:hypothetical protein